MSGGGTRRPGERPEGRNGDEEHLSGLALALRRSAPYLNLGWAFVGPMVAGLLLGRFLDRRLEISPWATLAGLLLGMAAGFLALWRVAAGLAARGDRR